MTDEELLDYALKGMKADVTERIASVKMAMVRMKEAIDKSVEGHATKSRYSAVIDGLMSSLVALSESLDKAERFAEERRNGNARRD